MVVDDSSVCSAYLKDESATLALGGVFAQVASPGMVIYLLGDLGAGKTTFTRGLLNGLGHQGKVRSPTYTLVESYDIAHYQVHHFDLYRFADPSEWEDAGFREYFSPDSLCLVEWPQQAAALLPAPDVVLELTLAESGRRYRLIAHTDTGKSCLISFAANC
ncbi:tRNA (adenosine(37)-N6)-threonylcarbamoyltransferase complex ATPase subunit type 1 TsaE [Neisseriaceae bacterium TC5R-5]|nr:tRNA (adenosine(37)-N6)-threonylcarbamoyltransferase complex ATPase subunit type 1 TsaE [Neisseriaceae bacterium TC5R-5]